MIDLIGMLKYAGLAWKDKGQIEHLVEQAKVLEGPKPSWKTGEFWVNVVAPTTAGIIGGAAAVVSAPALVPYFIIATTVLSLGAYLGRQWLKAQHLKAGGGIDLADPAIAAQISSIVTNVTSTVNAIKAAAGGDIAPAKAVTETLNAPEVQVNVGTTA